jgi:hypothetical protein
MTDLLTVNFYSQTSLESFTFTVPGPAFIDGRDLAAKPPLTVNKINLWNGPNQAKIVGYLWHGTAVEIRDVAQGEQYLFFKVRFGTRSGWVSENMLSDRDYATVGEVI